MRSTPTTIENIDVQIGRIRRSSTATPTTAISNTMENGRMVVTSDSLFSVTTETLLKERIEQLQEKTKTNVREAAV